jgi:transcriptional regulator with XRE-family HTH domain
MSVQAPSSTELLHQDVDTPPFSEAWRDWVASDPRLEALVSSTEDRNAFLRGLANLRERMRRRSGDGRYTQEWLADRMDTQQPNVARLETGTQDPRVSTLERYAVALGGRLELRLLDAEGHVLVVSTSHDRHGVARATAGMAAARPARLSVAQIIQRLMKRGEQSVSRIRVGAVSVSPKAGSAVGRSSAGRGSTPARVQKIATKTQAATTARKVATGKKAATAKAKSTTTRRRSAAAAARNVATRK